MSSRKQSKPLREENNENERFGSLCYQYRTLIRNAPHWWELFAVRRWMKQMRAVK